LSKKTGSTILRVIRKAIIFGVTGQDGHYLTELLVRQQIKVLGVARKGAKINGDVSNNKLVESLIKMQKPDYIFHFAANSTTSHEALFENHLTISTGTLNILESVYKYSRQTKVFISGSGLQFANNGRPISENNPFMAQDAYSISRIQSVYAARYYMRLGIQVYVGYFFHHDSPLRTERHLSMRIAMAAKRIKEGSEELIEIGDLNVVKEYNHAGDIMKAVWLLVNQTQYFEVVLGSGKGYNISEWIEICSHLLGINCNDKIRINDTFKAEFRSLVSEPALLYSMGWEQEIGIEELARQMIYKS